MAQFSGKYLQVSFPLKWSIPLGLILHAHTHNASPTTSSTFLWRRPKIDLKARPLLTHPRYLLQFLYILIKKRSLKERNSLFDISTQNKLCEFPSCQVVYLGALLCFKCLMSASPDRLLGFTAADSYAASRLLPKMGHAGESVSSLCSASPLFLESCCCATAAVKAAWLWLISREGLDVKSPCSLQVSSECGDFWCHQSVEWIKR